MSNFNKRKLPLILLLTLSWVTGSALEPTTPLADYGRQSWVMENGLPQNSVHALLQTHDGYLWFGTESGLVRFDGNAFAVFDRSSIPSLPSADIRCLAETKDGALWIGTSEGLARLKDGAVTGFTTRDGLPGNSIRSLAEDAEGVLWALTDAGLARRNGEKFEIVKAGDGLPEGTVMSLTVDSENNVWVATAEGLASRTKRRWLARRLRGTLPNSGIEFVQTLPGGLVFGSKSELSIDRESQKAETLLPEHELPGSRIQALLVDREKSIWIGTNGGLCRWIDGKVQKLPCDGYAGQRRQFSRCLKTARGTFGGGTEDRRTAHSA